MKIMDKSVKTMDNSTKAMEQILTPVEKLMNSANERFWLQNAAIERF